MQPESIEKTRGRLGLIAHLKRYRPVAAAVATVLALVALPYTALRFLGFASSLFENSPEESVSTVPEVAVIALPVIAVVVFIAASIFFYWKRSAADWVIDRSVYFYRLTVFPLNVLVFRAFRTESGLEQKLRSTERIRRRHARKTAAKSHRENLRK